MKKMQKILILCCVLVCFISANVLAAAPEQSEDFATNEQDSEKENRTDVQVEGVVERNAKMIENRDEIKVTETTGANTIASCKEVNGIQTASATNEISAIMYNLQSDYIDVGALYTTNDPNPQFRWLEYNLNTKTWRVFDNWRSGNWASWKTSVGDYWLQCEMKTSDGQVAIKTTEFHYTAGNLKITDIYAGATEANDTTMLFGMTSNLSNVKYSFKIYNVATGKWSALTYLDTKQWIEWAAKTGSYWMQYELYTSDGRMADYKTHVFSSTEPVRRALVMGEVSTSAVPIGDVNNMDSLNKSSKYFGKKFYSSEKFVNKTKSQILNKIQTTFADTTDNDVSYLYFTCHGGDGGTLYLEPHKMTFTPAELRDVIDTYIKGKVVIMIDSCHAGGSIQKSADFAQAFIQAFEGTEKSGELENSRFAVLCSSRKDESSQGGATISLATKYWTKGAGWDYSSGSSASLLADRNGDNKVTLDELCVYSYVEVAEDTNEQQRILRSSNNGNMVIYGRY